MPQKIKNINIKDLVLWTENPRDPIDKNADNKKIAKHAVSKDGQRKWKLKKLATSMGKRYDTSELPTVVYDDGIPLVYDGNRRVLIGKIKNNCVTVDHNLDLLNLDFPQKIPCNVCDEQTALEHVNRKHGDNGTWGELERDIFKRYHMKEKKSVFLAIDEKTKIITENSFMNKRFVKEEAFSQDALDYLGFLVEDDELVTPYNDEDLMAILNKTVKLVEDKEITTRKNRYALIALLEEDPKINSIISKNNTNKPSINKNKKSPPVKKNTPRNKSRKRPLFGEYMPHFKDEIIENLFLDLRQLHSDIYKDKSTYSEYATMIVAMGLRLLCQVADKKHRRDLNKYIDKYFEYAEKELTAPEQRYLAIHNVRKQNMARLLNDGSHENSDALNREQTVALSLIIVKILEKTHGAETSK